MCLDFGSSMKSQSTIDAAGPEEFNPSLISDIVEGIVVFISVFHF
jgi:hypothetical protein